MTLPTQPPQLYRTLCEEDALYGLWRQRCGADITRSGLALQQHGFASEAMEAFSRASSRAVALNFQNMPARAPESCAMLLWRNDHPGKEKKKNNKRKSQTKGQKPPDALD